MQRIMNLMVTIVFMTVVACGSNSKVGPNIKPIPDPPENGTGSEKIEIGKPLPKWEKGEMDIHFINTTTGECTFIIMPDGTQLLIDIASSTVATNSNGNTTNSGIRSRWDPTKTNTRGSQIIADHIRKCMVWTGNNSIDYFVATHHDNDHIGGYSSTLPISKNSSTYRLNGISEILDEFNVGKFMDRGYPDYNYPFYVPSYRSNLKNQVTAIKWHVANKGLNAEIFKAGSNTQIVPKTSQYDVRIQNIAVNGEIWTGIGTATKKTFPELSEIRCANPPTVTTSDKCPPENICSAVMKISYGKFDYYATADLQYTGRSTYAWKDAELPCAQVVGKVELMKAAHHGVTNSNQPEALRILDPQTIVVCSWVDCHPRTAELNSMATTLPNADFFITNFWKGARPDGVDDKVTAEEAARVKGWDGHIIIRVTDGGNKYRVITTTDSDGKMTVKSVSNTYNSR